MSATASASDAPPSVHTSSNVSGGGGGGGKRRTFKVIVIGDSGVGKTCLTFRFCAGHFPGTTEATIGVDFREKILHVDNEDIRLQLWDTAGQERFRRSMVGHYYRNVSAAVLVYDVTRRSSFDALAHWVRECQQHGISAAAVPVIVVGNKFEDGIKPAVTTAEAQRFADDNGMPLFETSAKDDSRADHVEAIFMTLAHKVKQNKPLMSSGDVGAGADDAAAAADGERTVRPGKRIVYQNDTYSQGGGCCG